MHLPREEADDPRQRSPYQIERKRPEVAIMPRLAEALTFRQRDDLGDRYRVQNIVSQPGGDQQQRTDMIEALQQRPVVEGVCQRHRDPGIRNAKDHLEQLGALFRFPKTLHHGTGAADKQGLGGIQVGDAYEHKQEADRHSPADAGQTDFQARGQGGKHQVEAEAIEVFGTPMIQAHSDDAQSGQTDHRHVKLGLEVHIDNTGMAQPSGLARILYSFSLRSSVRREIPSRPAAISCRPPDFSSASRITCSSRPPS